jgi:phosphoenolpyruvate-protein kinase (PTS system EI component)
MLEVKSSIRKVSVPDAKMLAAEALEMGTAAEVEALLARRRAAGAPAK